MSKVDRNRLYKLLNLGRREVGMDDETYRVWLAQQGATDKGGRPSASTLSNRQLIDAVEALKAKGFKIKPKARPRAADWKERRIAKINALWIDLHALGAVRDRSEAAMLAWAKGQPFGIDHLTMASSEQINKCVEALKSWRDRAARKAEANA